ncbi:hypothetical protein [Bizionia sp. M204]|uniref:hypothetical protein n=1 Tax=Bizionia sp. M204 TaxID=2675331 RepID=UPI00205254B1|nr:hypothetical protein [Bizionia sp. M204]UPS92518.1 hypothetical protein GMA17_12630 [Bizionia sp. M204]
MIMRYPIVFVFLCGIVTIGCSVSKSKVPNTELVFQNKASFVVETVQFQPWISDINGNDSGYHIYITISENKNQVTLSRIYFKGFIAKIQVGKTGYFASIQTSSTDEADLIMSENQNDEYGNIPIQLPNNRFNFGENTCVITYIENGEVKYFEYPNMIKKEL